MKEIKIKDYTLKVDEEDYEKLKNIEICYYISRKKPYFKLKFPKISLACYLLNKNAKRIIYKDGDSTNLQKLNLEINSEERKKQKYKDYYLQNKEKRLANQKKYNIANRKIIAEKQKKYRKQNNYASDKKYRKKTEVKKYYSDYYSLKLKTFNYKYSLGKNKAIRKGKDFSIQKSEYLNLMEQGCFYCGSSLDKNGGLSLDRIDNCKGYSIDNVLPCCRPCNVIKNEFLSVQETKAVIELIQQMRNTKNIWERK